MIKIPGYAKPPSYFARNISLSPAGNISSTTLQAGIEELDSEKTTESYVNTAAASVPTGSKNLIYNGAMQVAQRGTSATGITGGGYFTADRWQFQVGSAGTWTQTVESDAPDSYANSLKMLCTANATLPSGGVLFLRQRLEGQDLQRLAKGSSSAKTISFSFWVKSNVTGTYVLNVADIDNVRDICGTYTIASANTWEYKTLTFAGDSIGAFDNDNSESMQIIWWLDAGSDFTTGTLPTSWQNRINADRAVGQTNLAAATNNYWQVTGVQLEVGDTATEFEHLPYGVELARCQRYYYVAQQGISGADIVIGVGNNYTSSEVNWAMHFPTTMRALPTLVSTSGSGYYGIARNGGTDAFDNAAIYRPGLNSAGLFSVTGVSGTAGQAGNVSIENVSGLIAFNSEL